MERRWDFGMRVDGNFTLFQERRPAAMVVSHERSGTHFLMNSLAACYGYVATPWIDFDASTWNINYFYLPHVRDLLLGMAERPMANVVKSHHAVDFFQEELASITRRYVLFVICRHPVPTMLSFWRFLHQWPWNEGPKAVDPVAFAKTEPWGRIQCYQMRQCTNMLARWAAHVEGWLDAAADCRRIVVVRYEDLNENYEATVRGFATPLGRLPQAIARPPRDSNVIPPGPPNPTGCGLSDDLVALRKLCQDQVGPTMSRLGYV
jgi:hypothetical protein